MTVTTRYDAVAQTLHWLMALLIIATFALGLLVDVFPHSWEYTVVAIPKALGFSILVLVFLRFVWRLGHRPPPLVNLGALIAGLSRLSHFALYVLMILVPLIGLVYSARSGYGVDFGVFTLPPPPFIEVDRAAARATREIHELAAYLLIGLAGFHGLAALWHHFIRKDDILLRMLPGRPPR